MPTCPTEVEVESATTPSSVKRSHGSESPSDCAVSSPKVSASSPRESNIAGTRQMQNTTASRLVEVQLMKAVLPRRKVCISR